MPDPDLVDPPSKPLFGARTWIIIAIKLALTVACLWWVLRGIDIENSVFASPGDLHLGWVTMGCVCAGVAVLVWAVRWAVVLRILDLHVPFMEVLRLTFIGSFFNLFAVGALGGDAAKVVLLIPRFPNRKLEVTASIIIDHIMGVFALGVVFFALTITRYDTFADAAVLGQGVMAFAFCFIGGGMVMFLLGFVTVIPRCRRKFERYFPRLSQRQPLVVWHESFEWLAKHWRLTLVSVAISVLLLLMSAGSFFCSTRAVGVDAGLGTVLSIMPVVEVIVTLPISIAGIGVREKVFELLMWEWGGIPSEGAVAGSMLGFFCSLFWSLIGGLWFLAGNGNIRSIVSRANEPGKASHTSISDSEPAG